MAERNPDEFYYGMLSSQSRKGRKLADRQNPKLGQDVVKLLKTQDTGYVTTMLQKTKRARLRLEQVFVINEGQGAEVLGSLSSLEKETHKVFVNSREEQRRYKADLKFSFQPDSTTRKLSNLSASEKKGDSNGTPHEHLPNEEPELLRTAEYQKLALKQDEVLQKQRSRQQDVRKSKLAALNAREKDLTEAKNQLDVQRARMSNSAGGITKLGAKWKVRERKK